MDISARGSGSSGWCRKAVRSMKTAKTKLRKKARKRERTQAERCLQSWVRKGVRAG